MNFENIKYTINSGTTANNITRYTLPKSKADVFDGSFKIASASGIVFKLFGAFASNSCGIK